MKYMVGDEVIVMGDKEKSSHYFQPGTVVVITRADRANYYPRVLYQCTQADGRTQWIYEADLGPLVTEEEVAQAIQSLTEGP